MTGADHQGAVELPPELAAGHREGERVAAEAVRRWAAANGVGPMLRTSPYTLLGSAARDLRLYGIPTVEALLSGAAPSGSSAKLLGAARVTAWRYLAIHAHQAAQVRATDAQLVERARSLEGPGARQVVEHLLELRRPLPARTPAHGAIVVRSISAESLAVAFKVWFGTAYWDPVVTLPAAPSSDERFACTCSPSGEPCVHRALAIDAVLSALVTDGDAAPLRALLVEVAKPGWQRALERFDETTLAASDDDAVGHLSWHLVEAYEGWSVKPMLTRVGKSGQLLKPKKLRGDALDVGPGITLEPGEDTALALLRAERELLEDTSERTASSMTATTARRALAALAGHPRIFLEMIEGDLRPLAVSRARVEIHAVVDADGTTHLEVRIGARVLTPADVDALRADAAGGLALFFDDTEKRCLVVDVPTKGWSALALASSAAARFPIDARAALFRRLPSMSEQVPVELDPALAAEEVAGDPRPIVRIEPRPGEAALRVSVAVRPLPGLGALVPGAGPAEHTEVDASTGAVRTIRRDLAQELDAAVALVVALPPLARAPQVAPFTRDLEGEPALELLQRLQAHDPPLTVEWPAGRKVRVAATLSARDLTMRVVDGVDWFGLEGAATIDRRELALAAMLEAARGDRRFVRLEGDTWVELDASLRAHLGRIEDLAQGSSAGTVRVGRVAPFVLADLERELGAVVASAGWSAAVERLRTASAR
ncbi:hypothetical protein L6R52_09015, partial [Myxococcota bacterium]|nr:hypothetical protein [Myxococcota bacterium]